LNNFILEKTFNHSLTISKSVGVTSVQLDLKGSALASGEIVDKVGIRTHTSLNSGELGKLADVHRQHVREEMENQNVGHGSRVANAEARRTGQSPFQVTQPLRLSFGPGLTELSGLHVPFLADSVFDITDVFAHRIDFGRGEIIVASEAIGFSQISLDGLGLADLSFTNHQTRNTQRIFASRFGSSKFRRRRAALEVYRETLVRVFGAGVCQNLTSKKKVRNQGKLLKTLKIPCGRAQQDPTRDENKKSK